MATDAQPRLPGPALSPEEYKYVDEYMGSRDVTKAAVAAGFPAKQGSAIYRRRAVHAEIERRMENVTAEADKLIAKKRVVNVEILDKELMVVARIPKAILHETPSLATPKVNAIELGYRRIGLLVDDNFIPDASSVAAAENAPRIYRPTEQSTIITHTITETKEIVTTGAPTTEQIKERVRAMTSPPAVQATPKSQPPTIEAVDEWANF